MQRKRALLYARVSTEKQADEDKTSLQTQLAACQALADRQGWEVVATFTDEASGYTLDRPGLDEVRRLVRDRQADLVIAHKQERLSRSQVDTGVLYREFWSAGASIWTVQEGTFENTPLGRFIVQSFAFAAEMDREQRREATMRGQRAKVEKGYLLGAGVKPTYGYRWQDERDRDGKLLKHRYEEDPDTADVVRQIFAGVLAGVSLKQIALRLTEAGVPTPYGSLHRYRHQTTGKWGHQTVKRILVNPMYKGQAIALSTQQRTPKEDSKRHTPVPLPAGVVPALVSATDWDQAQAIHASRLNWQVRLAAPERALLRGGLVRCGNCGRAMQLAARGTGLRNRYYHCHKGSHETTPCSKPSPTIKTDYIEEPVWALVRGILLDPTKIWDRYHSREQHEHEAAVLAGCRKRLAEIETRRSSLLRNLELLGASDVVELRPRLDELAAERDDLTRQVTALEYRVASRAGERARMGRLLRWAQTEVQRVDALTAEEKRAVLIELGVVVHVYPSRAPERYTVELSAKLKPEPGTIFANIDWDAIREPTLKQRRETERLNGEATVRGQESDIIGALLSGVGSAGGHHTWDYWDEHVQEALAQHAGVLWMGTAAD